MSRDENVRHVFSAVLDGEVEEWVAVKGGGFEKATYDLPALLYDANLLHLYDLLIDEDLMDLMTRCEENRVKFLDDLKEFHGLTKLSDRQLLANALGRAKRVGLPGAAQS